PATRGQRDHDRARRAVPDVAHCGVQARPGAGAGRARSPAGARPRAPLPLEPRAAASGHALDGGLPGLLGRPPGFLGKLSREEALRAADPQVVMAPSSPPPPLRLVRVFPARPAEVFEAWTDPQSLAQWMCPGAIRETVAELDVRVGGRF